MPTSPEKRHLVAIGAHPDDIEFGCAAILLKEAQAGARCTWVVCSRGEAGTDGTPEGRTQEAEQAAALGKARLVWLDLGGDAHMEDDLASALKLARLIRELKPNQILAPTLVDNQHPDHSRVGRAVQRAARLARYGGLAELHDLPIHKVECLLHYRITGGATPAGCTELVFDISAVVETWKEMMGCHASQLKSMNYLDYQLTQSRLLGMECGFEYGQALYVEEGLVLSGLGAITGAKRHF